MIHEPTAPVTVLKGVGEEASKRFRGLGVKTVGDLIDYLPRRYDDFSVITDIGRLQPGAVTVEAVIKQVSGRYVRRGMHITEAVASDDTGSVRLVWFNQPYRAGAIKLGQKYFVSGVYELRRQRFAIMSPSIELVSDFPVNTARVVPVYRETKGLNSKQIRRALREAAPSIRKLSETLPRWLLEAQGLEPRASAVMSMHFPKGAEDLSLARQRLGFEEVFRLTLASLLNRYELMQDSACAIPFDEKLAKKFVRQLPFELTEAQREVVWRIYQDMQKPQPMNRLVEGDVGSGKTVVAAMAAMMAIAEGYQVAFMAPTELLARQHAETLYKLLKAVGQHESVALLVGGLKPAAKREAVKRIISGEARCIVGTHALIQEGVDMHNLGLVIIDEQHRFGVEQRKTLMAKAGYMPHMLSLTATPIPRSLALTLYGELDVSVLGVKPVGRQTISTEICSPNSRAALYARIDEELANGRQMFVVCPLITQNADADTEGGGKPARAARSAQQTYEELLRGPFKHRKLGLLHGRMKAQEKQETMQAFVEHKIDILVSTTVIEVGVDVPNASIMLIESADRFGLAQIHQLRGRVGRGQHKGYCYLMMSDSSSPPQRLRSLERIHDGFRLAELDLELRGPGAIYGTLQHGALDLRVASLADTRLIAAARAAAKEFIERNEDLLQYPELHAHVARLRAVTNLN